MTTVNAGICQHENAPLVAPGRVSAAGTGVADGGGGMVNALRRLVDRWHPERVLQRRLNRLYRQAPVIPLAKSEKVIILSDAHVGNGGSGDDFRPNASLIQHLLAHHYLPGDYRLVLNGDIEELQNFFLPEILKAWPKFYEICRAFADAGRLVKILGNHDDQLRHQRDRLPFDVPLLDSVILRRGPDRNLFVSHGHHAGHYHHTIGRPCGYLIKWVAYPLGFRNFTYSHHNRRPCTLERRIYELSRRNGIISIIGHTHRPLFESLSKIDELKFRIETLCRDYADASERQQEHLAAEIRWLREGLDRALQRRDLEGSDASIYNRDVVVPCLFNSGCTIGKRGVTAIEIENGRIRLVYWYDGALHSAPQTVHESRPEAIDDSGYLKVVLREDCLKYIFARIHLLAEGGVKY